MARPIGAIGRRQEIEIRLFCRIWIALPATKKVAMETAEASVLTIWLLLKYKVP
jgi:hypothetical protein